MIWSYDDKLSPALITGFKFVCFSRYLFSMDVSQRYQLAKALFRPGINVHLGLFTYKWTALSTGVNALEIHICMFLKAQFSFTKVTQ